MTRKYLYLFVLLVSIFGFFYLTDSTAEASGTKWSATFYPTENFKGTPVKATYDSINFNWRDKAPISGIPSDHFSATFESEINVAEGAYNLRVWANDGVQVYVDGKLEIDQWHAKSRNFFGKPIYLKSGTHKILIKYREITGVAELNFSIDDLLRDNRWYGLAFPKDNLTGTPELLGYQPQIPVLNMNWGWGSPAKGIPSDNFSTLFQRKITVEEGAYNLRVWANDGVQVYVDGKLEIDEWNNNQGLQFFGKPIYLTAGTHTIMIKHKELVGVSELRFDIDDLMRDNRWYGLAFPNNDLTGTPELLGYQPQIPELNMNWGWGSPAKGIPSDHFSTFFQRKINVEEGAYNLRVWANDGVQVYVDGRLEIDEWDNNQGLKFFGKPIYLDKGTHTIKIKYREVVGVAELRFSIDDLMREDRWYGLAFPSTNFTGTPELLGYQPQVPELDFDWGTGSPAPNIPVDHFSTYFQRYINTDKGNYQLTVDANDGVQVFLDGKIVLDQWNNISQGKWSITIPMTQGRHKLVVKNYEGTGIANLKVDFKPVKSITTTYVSYNLTLDEMVNIQMKATPQTDKRYPLWIREDAFKKDSIKDGKGIVEGNNWNLRRGPGTNYDRGGQVNNGQVLTIYNSTKGTDSYTWYHVMNTSGWVIPDSEDLKYYINPTNFTTFKDKLQFAKLSQSADINLKEVNEKILKGKGILEGKADIFLQAGEKSGVNEIYLISHALLETGNGTSPLATGVRVGKNKDEKPEMVTPENEKNLTEIKKTYNMFGIRAYDKCALKCGAEYAYSAQWYTPDAAILGGAKFIGEGYIDKGQDTLYKMRWDPSFAADKKVYGQQYATDIGWATKQTSKMNELYGLMDIYSITFEIPVYK